MCTTRTVQNALVQFKSRACRSGRHGEWRAYHADMRFPSVIRAVGRRKIEAFTIALVGAVSAIGIVRREADASPAALLADVASGPEVSYLSEVVRPAMTASAARAHKKVLLCIDEAQSMPLETMEALRLLTNLETEKRKLMQIVLFGQPELSQKLAEPSIRQLTQRITFNYHLGPLDRGELDSYIQHRLDVAGYQGPPLFSLRAIKALHRACGGIPRLANILAHKALLVAFGQGVHEINSRHVRAAAKDTLASRRSRSYWWTVAALTLSIASAGMVAWAYFK